MQGAELKSLWKQLGMTQGRLAEALTMNRTTISDMENDRAPIERRTELSVRYLLVDAGRA